VAEHLAVRPVEGTDIPEVLRLWETSRSITASIPDQPDFVRQLIEHTEDALLVAELDGRIVGALVAAWDGWRGNMYRLAVHRGHRRVGIARQLVRAGEERLRARGALRVTALVPREDEAAASLWSAAGYERDPYVERFVKNL